jgi:hypothetical protein
MDTKDYLKKMAGIEDAAVPVSRVTDTEDLDRLQVLAGLREKDWGVVSEATSTLNALSDAELIQLANKEGFEKSVVKDAEGGLANRRKLIAILSDELGEDTMEESLAYSLNLYEIMDDDSIGEVPSCPACDGPGVPLGSLGQLQHFRCRNCGIDFNSKDGIKEAFDSKKDRHSRVYGIHMKAVDKHVKDLESEGHEVYDKQTSGGDARPNGTHTVHKTVISYKAKDGSRKKRHIVGSGGLTESILDENLQKVADKHMTAIAKKTLKMNDVGANIMGGMTKEEARAHLKKVGYSDESIKKLEENFEGVLEEDKVTEATGIVVMSKVPTASIVDNQSELENRMGVDVMRDNKIKVPEKVKSQVKQRIAELKDAIAQYDEKGYNDSSVKKQAIECLEKIMDNLESGDLEGFKKAQIYFQTLMSPLTDLMPAALVNFLAKGQ